MPWGYGRGRRPSPRSLNTQSSKSMTATEKCRIVIVGAGASGLYCAHLLKEYSVVVLEARDRIGGRIHSVEEKVRTVQNESTKVVVDHGAAWVHGTGFEWGADITAAAVPKVNPMMELLVEAKGTQNLYQHHLRPVCIRGNPWMRPKHVLQEANEIVLYVAGQRLKKDDPVIEKATARHFDLLNQVSSIGNDMFEDGRGMDTVFQSLEETMTEIKQRHPLEGQDSSMIEALTNLLLYIMECWYGGQASEMQLNAFTNLDGVRKDQDTTYTNEGDFYGPHCTLHDGMKTVLEPLLISGAAERVRCGQEVIRIQETSNNTVVIKTKAGLTIEAECCVVTIPVGCLQDVISNGKSLFHPSLSDQKKEVRRAPAVGGCLLYELTSCCLSHDLGYQRTQDGHL